VAFERLIGSVILLLKSFVVAFHKDLKVEWWPGEAYLYPHSVHSSHCSSLCVLPLETTNQETTRWVQIEHLWQTHFYVQGIVLHSWWSLCDPLSLCFKPSRGSGRLWKSLLKSKVFTKVINYVLAIKLKNTQKNIIQLNQCKSNFFELFIFRPFLNKRFVVSHYVLAQQVFQASRESLGPRDQQVLQAHPEIVAPKDPWVHEGARAMKAHAADAVSLDPKELRDSRDQRVLEEAGANKVLQDVEGPQVPKELMVFWWKTGNSAFFRSWVMAGILAW